MSDFLQLNKYTTETIVFGNKEETMKVIARRDSRATETESKLEILVD